MSVAIITSLLIQHRVKIQLADDFYVSKTTKLLQVSFFKIAFLLSIKLSPNYRWPLQGILIEVFNTSLSWQGMGRGYFSLNKPILLRQRTSENNQKFFTKTKKAQAMSF